MAKVAKSKQIATVPWTYNYSHIGEVSIPDWACAFVYVIRHQIGEGPDRLIKLYVGKKQLMTKRRKRIGIREKVATKTRKTFKTETKVSDWQNYWGSSNSLKMAKESGIGTWDRIILYWCHSKKHATYLELRTQMEYRVLENESYNDNINGSIYRKDLIRLTKTEVLKQ